MDAPLSSARRVSDELDVEDYSLIHQYNLNSCGIDLDFTTQAGDIYKWLDGTKKHRIETLQTNNNGYEHHRPTKQFKISNTTTTTTTHVSPKHSNSSSSQFVSFEPRSPPNLSVNPKVETEMHFCYQNPKGTDKRPLSMTRTPTHAQDHVLAERKRREKLSERFIALSAMIPGLKKTDKATVLGDAIKYLKQLQERSKVLETQSKKRTVESVVFHKSRVSDDDASSYDENFDGKCDDQTLPELEARVSDKDVLIRIHCPKHKGLVPKIVSEVESYNLSVDITSALPFGSCNIDITIVAKMEDGFSMTVKDLAKNLRFALLKLLK